MSPVATLRRPDIAIPSQCRGLIERSALVAVNHSGGKDSQAVTILLSRIVPHDQLLIVHAPLGDVEWPGTIEQIQNTIPPGAPLIMAPVASGKSLLERVEERGMWPSKSARWCTSDAKRGPIERELRRYLKAHPRFEGRLVNALGLRRDESPDRARRIPWRRNERMSVAGREVFDWLPVFDLTTKDVFRIITEAGQSPHPVYSFGLSRCSCSFCIFASRPDLRRAAELRPDLYRKYAQLERRIGHTLSPTRVFLPKLTGIPVETAIAPAHPTHLWCSARRAAYAPPPVPMRMILRTPVAACRAGNRATNLVVPRIETQRIDIVSLI